MNEAPIPTQARDIRLPSPEEVERLFKPIELAQASGEWINARAARQLVMDAFGLPSDQAEAALCRRALSWVRVKINSFSRSEDPYEGIDRFDFFEGREADLTHFTDRPTPHAYAEVRQFFETLSKFAFEKEGAVRLACWASGDFTVKLAKDFSYVTMRVTGVVFDKRALQISMGLEATSSNEASSASPRQKRLGGKPARSHGEAIARITLRLSRLEGHELKSCTTASVAAELAEAYQEIGEAPPSIENADKLAAGILRVLRAERR